MTVPRHSLHRMCRPHQTMPLQAPSVIQEELRLWLLPIKVARPKDRQPLLTEEASMPPSQKNQLRSHLPHRRTLSRGSPHPTRHHRLDAQIYMPHVFGEVSQDFLLYWWMKHRTTEINSCYVAGGLLQLVLIGVGDPYIYLCSEEANSGSNGISAKWPTPASPSTLLPPSPAPKSIVARGPFRAPPHS